MSRPYHTEFSISNIKAAHGKTYVLTADDRIVFPGPLQSPSGTLSTKYRARYVYRWSAKAFCYLYVESLYPIEGNTYGLSPVTEVPTPTPEPTPSPVPARPFRATFGSSPQGQEVFCTDGRIVLGFNADGGLGTSKAAPAGFLTDTRTGFNRVSLYLPQPDGARPVDDLLLQGRSIGGFIAVVNGKSSANQLLNGWRQIPGKFVTATDWEGAKDGLAIRQVHGFTVDGAVSLDVTLKNTTAAPMDYAYAWCLDVDASGDNAGGDANFATVQKVSAGSVTCTTTQGTVLGLSVSDTSARVYTAPYNKSYLLGTERAIGYTKKVDETVQLAVSGKLMPGEERTVRYLIDVKVPA